MSGVLIALVALQASTPAGPSERYETCLQQIGVEADTAYEEALAWRHQGGGWPAEHCVFLALIALGEADAGATRLRAAAESAIAASDISRAIMFGQAGDGFLQAEDFMAARSAFERGLTFVDSDSGLYRGVAEAALAQSDFAGAEAAASQAFGLTGAATGQTEALRLRAESRLGLVRYEEALADVEAARVLSPDNIEILLLRGRIREAIRLSEATE